MKLQFDNRLFSISNPICIGGLADPASQPGHPHELCGYICGVYLAHRLSQRLGLMLTQGFTKRLSEPEAPI